MTPTANIWHNQNLAVFLRLKLGLKKYCLICFENCVLVVVDGPDIPENSVSMKFGYARVSTDDQNLGMQIEALKRAGCDKIFEEKTSGATFQRKQLQLLDRYLRPGDTLVVWKLDRLGRNSIELQQFIAKLIDRGVRFESLQDFIDTSTAQGKFAFQMMSAIAEMESNITRERTKAGIAAARERGVVFGRTTDIVGEKREAILADMKNVDMTLKEVAAKWGYAVNTLSTHFKGVRRQALIDAGKRKPKDD